MQPSDAALQTLRELASADPEFALELAVSPRAALGRVRGMFSADDHQALVGGAHALPPMARLPVPPIGPGHLLSGGSGTGTSGSPQPHSGGHFAPTTHPWPTFTPCDNTPPSGFGTLRLTNTVGSTTTQIYERTVHLGTQFNAQNQPFVPTWTFEAPELNTQLFTLERDWLPPSDPLGVDFRTTGLSWRFPAEAQLFARDPEELGRFADTLETDPATIRAQVADWGHPGWAPDPSSSPYGPNHITLPDALSLVSPASPPSVTSFDPTNASAHPLTKEDFFGVRQPSWTGNTATDYGGGPSGFGSVKSARITYPGLCTLELLYARPTPVVQGAGLYVASGHGSIFDNLESILWSNIFSMCAHLIGLDVKSIIAFPLVRSDAHLGTGALIDSRGQLFLSIQVEGYSGWFSTCLTEASVIYDIKLDARGALVIEVAGNPILFANDPHAHDHVDVKLPNMSLEPHHVDWGWVSNAGHIQSGVAAFRIVDNGAGLCDRWGPIEAEGGPAPFTAGINSALAELLLNVVPRKLNAEFRHIQMFPHPADRGGLFSSWSCWAHRAVDDPQHHLYGTRKTFNTNLPLAAQTETGFGFINVGDTIGYENCAAARDDFCKHVRQGYAAMNNIMLPTCIGNCCIPTPGDPHELGFLLQAVTERDAFGNFAHWGCEGLDQGNQDCISGTNPTMLQQDQVTNQWEPVPNPSKPGQFMRCTTGQCLSRVPGTTPPDAPSYSSHFYAPPTLGYGCEPDITAGACYFLPPARRLIANPDGIQLVFYDNEGDCGNAAMALRYAIHGYYGTVSEGTSFPFPNFSTFPSPDYQIGAGIGDIAYYDSPSSPLQGRWNPAYQVGGHPMAICNYNRFNDLESPIVGGIEGSKQVRYVDTRGHPWRGYSFPRMYAVLAPIIEGMVSRRTWHC